MFKIAILTSHPIQYQTPLFKKISEHPEIRLTVYFREKKGAMAPYYDKEFRRKVQWEIPLLEGYSFVFLSGIVRLARELRTSPKDALVLYGWNSWINMFAFMLCWAQKVKIFMYAETPLRQEKKKKNLLQKIKRMILRFLFSRASAFLYIGEENKKFYIWLGVPEKKLFYMPYAVDNEQWGSEVKNVEKKHREKPTILFVGKLIPKKRPLDLIQAFAPLDEKAELLMVGEGVLRNELEEYVKRHNIKNVRFAGFVNQTELPEYYKNADMLVLSSGRGETWGLVVNEAMNFSLPVIVSDSVGCAGDLVCPRKNGFVYPEGDTEKLGEYLAALLRDKDMREGFGKESYNIIQNFSYEKDVEGILKALSSC